MRRMDDIMDDLAHGIDPWHGLRPFLFTYGQDGGGTGHVAPDDEQRAKASEVVFLGNVGTVRVYVMARDIYDAGTRARQLVADALAGMACVNATTRRERA